MKHKSLPLLIIFLFCLTPIMAQKRQSITFFTTPGKQVSTKDSADYIRVVSEPDSVSEPYNVNEFYKNGKPKLVARSVFLYKVVFTGTYISFYPSGKRKRISNYENGLIMGNSYEYYPNGKLYSVKEFYRYPKAPLDLTYGRCLLKQCNDSTGKTLAIDGNGYYITYEHEFLDVREEGQIKAGLKNGKWTGYIKYMGDTISYVEKYSDNQLIGGSSVINYGPKTQSYKVHVVNPTFTYKKDLGFADYLKDNLTYPKALKDQAIAAETIIQFSVGKDGLLTDLKIVNDHEDKFSEEVLQVFKACPKWTPAIYYGQQMPFTFTLPIRLQINSLQIFSVLAGTVIPTMPPPD